jgi:replication fork protection complex subunit Csm3/Swi3
MAYAASPSAHGGAATNDELDRLLDMDNTVDDFLNEIGVPSAERGTIRTPDAAARDEDQEVQVKRKRNPVPKLDESRYGTALTRARL